MRELTRSNDPVFLSYLRAELSAEGIEALVLDGFASSVLQPMNMTAEQRVMVTDEDYWRAWAVNEEAEERVSEDSILGGRVQLLQPKSGFRAAIDPILLAASVPATDADQVLEIGTGTGAAALCLLARVPGAWVTGIDVQPGLIALAERAAARNGMEERTRFQVMDVRTPDAAMRTALFDHVMSNPPFLGASSGQMPKDPARALATVESTADLACWLRFMADRLRQGGTLSIIHRADRADEILTRLPHGFGNFRRLNLIPVDDGRPVKRCIIQATKGGRPGRLSESALVVHREDGSFSADADAVLRDGKALTIS